MYHKQNVNYTLNKSIKQMSELHVSFFFYIFTFRKISCHGNVFKPKHLEDIRAIYFPITCKNLFNLQQPDCPWGPLSLQPNGYTVLCPQFSDRDVKLTTHLHIMKRLKMSEAIPLLPRIPSCCARGYFTFMLPTLNLTSVIIAGFSVSFKSQPTSHCISFLPQLHYATLLTFYPLSYFNRNTYHIAKSTKARAPCVSGWHRERQFSNRS
jgi:hypothetical protein